MRQTRIFLVTPLSMLIAVIFDLARAIFHSGSKGHNLAVVLSGGGLGVFFSALIPFYSAVVILVF